MPRNNAPLFWPEYGTSQSLQQSMNRNYTDCITMLQTMWYQMDLNQRFAMADQDLWGMLYPGVSTYRRKIFNFNLINAQLQMVSGYQRRNRKSTVCIPVQKEMQKTADQLTKCLYHIHNKGGLYQTYSDCFELGALTQGLGFTYFYKDTSDDHISGDICGRYIDPKSCIWDPYFRKLDMSDARFWWMRTFFDIDECALMHPQYEDEIRSIPRGTYRDDKFYYMPEVYQIQFPNLVAWDEYWYASSRKAEYMVDKETQECLEFQGDEEDARDIKYKYGSRVTFVTKNRPTVRRCVMLNDRVLVDEPNPYGMDRYPVAPCVAYATMDTPYYAYKFRGLVSDMKDAQFLYNRLKVNDLDQVEAQQAGLKIKKGSLVTPDDSLNQGNGRVLWIDKAAQMTDVEKMHIDPPSPVLLQMEEMLKDVMNRISGVNETMLGLDIDSKASILSVMRNSAGVTTLTRLFDQFDYYQTLCGNIIIEMVQQNWTFGKVKQVIGEEPTAEFDNKAFFKYGCKVIQSVLTETQQQLELQQLLYFRETTGIDIPAKVIIEASTLQNKGDLIKAIEEQEQARQQQEQQMQQLQMQQLQVENETKMAYARSQDGLAQERIAKIQLDKALNAERIQRAEEDKTAGVLNLIKAIKEIQGMDLDHLERSLAVVQSLEEGQGAKAEVESTKPVAQTANI